MSGRSAPRRRFRRGLGLLRRRPDRLRRQIAPRLRHRRDRVELQLLEPDIEHDIGRPLGARCRDLARAQDRFIGRWNRGRLVVPLGEIADEGAVVARRVDPVDPRPPHRRIGRPVGPQQHHRRAVAPGVVDRHRAVHQPDIGVDDGKHRLFRHLGPAMGDRHRRLLVQAEQHLRLLVAELVDEAVMEPAIRGAGIERHIGNVEGADHLGHGVAAPMGLALRRERLLDALRLVGEIDLFHRKSSTSLFPVCWPDIATAAPARQRGLLQGG